MDSSGLELHPNWRALTTLNVPLKRFVHAGAEEQAKGKAQKHQIEGVNGAEVQQFYNEILQTPPTTKTAIEEPSASCSYKRAKDKPQVPYDKSRFFRLATSNDVEQLAEMRISKEEELNACDAYGWTALMMAACEGAAEAVAWLLQQGANAEITDKSGKSALQLARIKGHTKIVRLLEEANDCEEDEQLEEEEVTPFYCDICQRDFTEATWRAHQTSTVHRFNMKSLPAHRLHTFNIPPRNRGLKLMVKQGWDRQHGLGPNQEGRLYPVKTVLRKQRSGLGVEQPPARVTHYAARDPNATKNHQGNPYQPRRTRDDMKREKLRDWRRERRLRYELS